MVRRLSSVRFRQGAQYQPVYVILGRQLVGGGGTELFADSWRGHQPFALAA